MAVQNKVSLPVIKRLPKYYRYLTNLSADCLLYTSRCVEETANAQLVRRGLTKAGKITAQHDEVSAHGQCQRDVVVLHDAAMCIRDSAGGGRGAGRRADRLAVHACEGVRLLPVLCLWRAVPPPAGYAGRLCRTEPCRTAAACSKMCIRDRLCAVCQLLPHADQRPD